MIGSWQVGDMYVTIGEIDPAPRHGQKERIYFLMFIDVFPSKDATEQRVYIYSAEDEVDQGRTFADWLLCDMDALAYDRLEKKSFPSFVLP